MLCNLRFLVFILMLIPSNANIPNCFKNVCLLLSKRSFINLARWVRFLSLKENEYLTYLDIYLIVTWNLWLMSWWNFVKNRLATSSFCGQYGNSNNIDSFAISKRLDVAISHLLGLVFYFTYTQSLMTLFAKGEG